MTGRSVASVTSSLLMVPEKPSGRDIVVKINRARHPGREINLIHGGPSSPGTDGVSQRVTDIRCDQSQAR